MNEWMIIIIMTLLIVFLYNTIYVSEHFGNQCNPSMYLPFKPKFADLKLVNEQTNDGPFFDFDITHPECDNRCKCRAIDNVLKHIVNDGKLTLNDAKRVWYDSGFNEWCQGVRID